MRTSRRARHRRAPAYLDKGWENGTYLQAYALYVLSLYGRRAKADALRSRATRSASSATASSGFPTTPWAT